jgi:hypothetical protein
VPLADLIAITIMISIRNMIIFSFFYLIGSTYSNAMTSAEAFKLVSDPQIAGKYKSWHCTEYSLALGAELERRHVRYARIHYTWWQSDSPLNAGEFKPEHAMHVITYFLTYDRGIGWQQWLADNENAKPVRVSGPLSSQSALRWIKGFSSPFGGPLADIGSIYIAAY